MNSCIRRAWMAAAWMAAAASTHAQPAPATSGTRAADPLQADAAVPPVVYSSPLARYRMAGDVEVGSWTEVNETVTRIGGWRTYAREASQPEAPASVPAAGAAPAASPPAAAPGHGRH